MKPFNKLRRDQRQVAKIAESCQTSSVGDKYWSKNDLFKEHLRAALKDPMLMDSLTRSDILDLLEWCSRYRPVEPFVALEAFAAMNRRLKAIQKKHVEQAKLRRQAKA